MTGHIVFDGVSIDNIINSIDVKKERTYSDSAYVGSSGSTTDYVSEYARVITCQSLCMHYEESSQENNHRIDDYKQLSEKFKETTGVLTSESNLDLKGNYLIAKCDVTEDTMGNFTIDWEFKEVVPFNVTKETFRVWNKATTTSSSSAKKKTTTTKKSGTTLSSNGKYLLKTCGTMKKGSKSTKCVKSLQKFLQAGGFYRGYKVDGVYSTYTFQAVKQAQKKRGLKQTGNWDTATRKYYQKKYNYP